MSTYNLLPESYRFGQTQRQLNAREEGPPVLPYLQTPSEHKPSSLLAPMFKFITACTEGKWQELQSCSQG